MSLKVCCRVIWNGFAQSILILSLTAILVVPESAFCQRNRDESFHNEVNAIVLNNLSFGTVIIGQEYQKDVTYTDPGAGRVLITGLQNQEDVRLKFDLPHELRLFSFGHGLKRELKISFDQNSAAWSTANDPSTGKSFDPHASVQIPTSALKSGKLYLWIGGDLILSHQQASGSYGGRIVVQVQIDNGSD